MNFGLNRKNNAAPKVLRHCRRLDYVPVGYSHLRVRVHSDPLASTLPGTKYEYSQLVQLNSTAVVADVCVMWTGCGFWHIPVTWYGITCTANKSKCSILLVHVNLQSPGQVDPCNEKAIYRRWLALKGLGNEVDSASLLSRLGLSDDHGDEINGQAGANRSSVAVDEEKRETYCLYCCMFWFEYVACLKGYSLV